MQGNFEVVVNISYIWIEAEGFVHDLHKQERRIPDTSITPAFSVMALQQFSWSSKNLKTLPIRQVSMASVHLTLKRAREKVFIPSLLNAVNEYDHDQKVQFCEWGQRNVLKDAEFMNKAV